MDHKFTEQIQEWLNTPKKERDYAQGALFLLKLSGNQIMYRNMMANPEKKAEFIEYQIQKYYNFRVQALTHSQVEEMSAQVEEIVKNNLSLAVEVDEKNIERGEPSAKGKRPDHDSLPDEIKAKFIENLDLLRRMREVHLRLRTMSLENATCPDSERYPYLKELIDLDKKLHQNWKDYDTYVVSSPQATPSNATKKTTKRASTKKKTA